MFGCVDLDLVQWSGVIEYLVLSTFTDKRQVETRYGDFGHGSDDSEAGFLDRLMIIVRVF